jgi:hypothetical protein
MNAPTLAVLENLIRGPEMTILLIGADLSDPSVGARAASEFKLTHC